MSETAQNEKQIAWLKKVVAMPFSEWKTLADDLVKRNQWRALREGASARLMARGLVDLGPAAGIRWIEKEWFEKAKSCGGLVWDEYNRQWIPGYYYAMKDDGEPVYDFRDYERFIREYKAWKALQPKRMLDYVPDLPEYAKTLFEA